MAEAQLTVQEQQKKARAEQIKNNEEKMAYDAKQRPTPSPDDMAAALAGVPYEADPHGAAPQDPNDPPHMNLDPHKRKDDTRTKRASAEGHDAPYQTRDMSGGKSK